MTRDDEFPIREIAQREGDAYPHEIAWTADRTRWTIPEMHLGRWTMPCRAAASGDDGDVKPGESLTRDEFNNDVIELAIRSGMQLDSQHENWLEQCRESFDSPVIGGARIPDPEMSRWLANLAEKAVDWLNSTYAPDGRRFVIADGLYLVETERA